MIYPLWWHIHSTVKVLYLVFRYGYDGAEARLLCERRGIEAEMLQRKAAREA